jgi:hypothetical protein
MSGAAPIQMASPSIAGINRNVVLPLTVYIGNISPEVDDAVLQKILECCGKVNKWNRPVDTNKKLRGFGFCTFDQGVSALRCFRVLNGLELGGQPLKVNAGSREVLSLLSIEETEAQSRPKPSGDDSPPSTDAPERSTADEASTPSSSLAAIDVGVSSVSTTSSSITISKPAELNVHSSSAHTPGAVDAQSMTMLPTITARTISDLSTSLTEEDIPVRDKVLDLLSKGFGADGANAIAAEALLTQSLSDEAAAGSASTSSASGGAASSSLSTSTSGIDMSSVSITAPIAVLAALNPADDEVDEELKIQKEKLVRKILYDMCCVLAFVVLSACCFLAYLSRFYRKLRSSGIARQLVTST